MSITSFTDPRENGMGLSPYLEYSSIGITTCVAPHWVKTCLSTAKNSAMFPNGHSVLHFKIVFEHLVFNEGLDDPVDTLHIDVLWSDGSVQRLTNNDLEAPVRVCTEEDRVCALYAFELPSTPIATAKSKPDTKPKMSVYYNDCDIRTTSEYQEDNDVEVPLLPGEMLLCSAGNVLVRVTEPKVDKFVFRERDSVCGYKKKSNKKNYGKEKNESERDSVFPVYIRYYGRRQGGRTLRKMEKVWQSQFYTIGGKIYSYWDDEEDEWRRYFRAFREQNACDDEMRLIEERERAEEVDVKSYGLHNFRMIRKNRKKNQRGRMPRSVKRNSRFQCEKRIHFRAEVDVCTRNGTVDDLCWIKRYKHMYDNKTMWYMFSR